VTAFERSPPALLGEVSLSVCPSAAITRNAVLLHSHTALLRGLLSVLTALQFHVGRQTGYLHPSDISGFRDDCLLRFCAT
jgi:hypothetical protein